MRGQGDIIGSVRAQILVQALQDTTVCKDRDQIVSTRYPGPNSLVINLWEDRQHENEADWDHLLGPKGFLKPAKLRVSGRINLFTATKEDFIACFEGQGCLTRVMK